MRRLVRPAAVLAAVVAVSLAGTASAASSPNKVTFTDPAGDNTSPGKASDILGVTWTTSGAKAGKTYTPKNLLVTMTLAAPPTSDGTTIYAAWAELAGCGAFSLSYSPGAQLIPGSGYAGCDGAADATGDGTIFDVMPAVKGSTLVWSIALKTLPGSVKAGSKFTDLHAYTDFVDPFTGILGVAALTEGPGQTGLYDNARTSATFTVG